MDAGRRLELESLNDRNKLFTTVSSSICCATNPAARWMYQGTRARMRGRTATKRQGAIPFIPRTDAT
jgi:hypothetical protein